MATAVSRYLDPAATGTGDGTSWANAYTSYATALSDIAADYPSFVTADVAVTLWVRGSNSWVDADNAHIAFTTDSTRYFRLKGENAISAAWSATAPTIASDDWYGSVYVDTHTCIVEDLQISATRSSGGNNCGVWWQSGSYLRVERCFMRSPTPYASSGHNGIRVANTGTNKTGIFVNNLSVGFYFGFYAVAAEGDKFVFYNNTAYGTAASETTTDSGYWLDGNAGTLTASSLYVHNCIGTNFATSDFNFRESAVTMEWTHNASQDTSGDNGGTTGCRINQTFTFVDPANNDFSLASTDAGALDFGTDLSANTHYAFDTDITNRGRPGGSAWDIGASEYGASSPVTLAPNEATHGHTADSVTLSSKYTADAADATHGHTADSLTLSVRYTVTAADATHGHTAENISLAHNVVLDVAQATHAHRADNVELGKELEMQSASHAHYSVMLGDLSQPVSLTVWDAFHGHEADAPTPSQNTFLMVVDDATHAQLADSLGAPSLEIVLAVDRAVHAHAADQVDAEWVTILDVADATHAHMAGNALPISGAVVVPAEQLMFVARPPRELMLTEPARLRQTQAKSRVVVVAGASRFLFA